MAGVIFFPLKIAVNVYGINKKLILWHFEKWWISNSEPEPHCITDPAVAPPQWCGFFSCLGSATVNAASIQALQ
jgi:hypothetical protein